MSDTQLIPHIEICFFVKKFIFERGTLTVVIGDELAERKILFQYVRTFLFFKESDFFDRLRNYEHEKIISGNERTVGVYKILKKSIVGGLLRGRLDEEEPNYFWVSTPDECLEVVSFSSPRLI